MKVKFLGTGTSTGVPQIGCKCEVCTSNDIRDRRLRVSVFVYVDGKKILIDCGPDFRQQMMRESIYEKIDAVLLTHEHYDHVGGVDDLRPFCAFGDINVFTNPITAEALRKRIPYCFKRHAYPGVPILNLHEVESEQPFNVGDLAIQPIDIMHFNLPIYGYRIKDFAYLTDVKTIPESEYVKMNHLDVLVIDALQAKKKHISHLTLEDALVLIERIAPKRAYLIHMGHHIGLHEVVSKTLPANVFLAYDGLELNIDSISE